MMRAVMNVLPWLPVTTRRCLSLADSYIKSGDRIERDVELLGAPDFRIVLFCLRCDDYFVNTPRLFFRLRALFTLIML